jgi:phospholipase/lecithinase/hemolysin
MARLLILCLISLLVPLALASTPTQVTPYDHVIIFGDSLSDIGDMPMSPSLIEPSTHSVALNLYVPISNPMVPDGHRYRVPLTHQYLSYPKASPTPSPLLNVNGKIFPRDYKSLNWTQFFVHEAQVEGLVSNQANLVPWIWWKRYSNKVRSINFAFAGATSQNNCRDFEYRYPKSECNSESVYKAQLPYRTQGFSQSNQHTSSVNLVQVPGVDKQVALFLEAAKQHPQLATKKTLYVIFVGGNDLNLALLNLSKHKYLTAFGALLHGTSHNVSNAISTLQHQANAQHIVVMNLFDMRETPYLHTNIVKLQHLSPKQENHLLTLTHVAVSMYNRQLKRLVGRINFFEHKMLGMPIQVTYFDTYKTLENMTLSPTFNQDRTRFLMCIKNSGMPDAYYSEQNRCTNQGAKYLFWNGAHPSIYVGEYIGYKLTQQLKKTFA